MLGPSGADGADDLERKANAVVEAAAVFVGALVGEGREKLVQKVAVRGVNFDEVKAGGASTMCGRDEVDDDLFHARAIEGGGDGVGLVEAYGGRCDGLPSAF